MTDHLTQNNGVVCHHCFKTIDLTKLTRGITPKWIQYVEKFGGYSNFFNVSCPHCNHNSSYSYADVKPISYLDQNQVEELFKKYLETKGDNVKMAKELALTKVNETSNAEADDITSEQTTLPDLKDKKKFPFIS